MAEIDRENLLQEKPGVNRRWFVARLGLSAAEMVTGLVTPPSLEPVGNSLFTGGFNTFVFTLVHPILHIEPIFVGVGSAIGTYVANRVGEVTNRKP